MIQEGHNYYGTPIGTRMRSIEWCHLQWPWTTPSQKFKVTPLFDAAISETVRDTDIVVTKNTFCRTRSPSNATFHFWSRDVHPVQNLLLCPKFHRNRMIFRWDMAMYRFSKWRPSAILKLFYHHTRPPTKSLLLAAAACQNSCQSDTQIWRAIWIFRIFGLKCLFRPPKWGFWGTLDP